MRLEGHRSETELSPARAAALRRALRELEPHEDHLVVGGVAHAMRGALDGTRDLTKDADDEVLDAVRRALEDGDIEAARAALGELATLDADSESDSELTKHIMNMDSLRTSLAKAEHSNPTVTERVVNAQRACSEEYLRKSAGAWSDGNARRQIEQAREIEGGRRAA